MGTPKEVMVPVQKRNFFAPTVASMSGSNGNGLQKSVAEQYPPRRIVQAIQQHPPLCGKNAYLEAKNFDQLQVGMGDKPPSLNTAKTTVKKPGLKLQDVELHRTARKWNTQCQQSSTSSRLHDNHTIDIRLKVRETLHFFKDVVTSLEGEKPKEGGPSHKRLDFRAAKILKDKGMYVNTGKQIIGPVPGVEVGDEFHYRVELTIIGLHRQTQAGIDFVKHGGKNFATSIVSSGNYEDDFSNESSIIYTGHGGNYMLPSEKGYDQKLERGNLALKNSLEIQNPIRVIHRFTSFVGRKTFVYKGLYKIKKCIRKRGNWGKLIWEFHLERVLESVNNGKW